MCLPLMSGTQLEGVFYVDPVDGVTRSRKDDQSMLTSMIAAIATTPENSSWQ